MCPVLPYLCVHCVLLEASTHCHVCSAARTARLCLGVDKSPTDAEVTEFDLTFSIQEDIGWFDVSVYNTVFLLQVQQCLYNLKNGNKRR